MKRGDMAKTRKNKAAPAATITEQLIAAVRQAEADPAGFSMRQIALRAGLTTGAVSRFMAGQRIPRADTADKLAAALGRRFVLLP